MGETPAWLWGAYVSLGVWSALAVLSVLRILDAVPATERSKAGLRLKLGQSLGSALVSGVLWIALVTTLRGKLPPDDGGIGYWVPTAIAAIASARQASHLIAIRSLSRRGSWGATLTVVVLLAFGAGIGGYHWWLGPWVGQRYQPDLGSTPRLFAWALALAIASRIIVSIPRFLAATSTAWLPSLKRRWLFAELMLGFCAAYCAFFALNYLGGARGEAGAVARWAPLAIMLVVGLAWLARAEQALAMLRRAGNPDAPTR